MKGRKRVSPDRYRWAIAARARSQRLLLGLYEFGEKKGYSSLETGGDFNDESSVYSSLIGVAFSLWRAAFLADMPTRKWPEVLIDAQELLETVISTNAIAFNTEHTLQGWTGGYYLTNVSLRLQVIARKQGTTEQPMIAKLRTRSLVGTDPHESWNLFCDEAERLAIELGCELPVT